MTLDGRGFDGVATPPSQEIVNVSGDQSNISAPKAEAVCMPKGAAPSDWWHFDLILGLGRDLLPVVSDQAVPISANSTMKAMGKTPSAISRGFAHGLSKWTERISTASDIDTWAKDDRLGICVQTRHVRALDIDIPDPVLSQEIAATFETVTGQVFPARGRSNSGKLLLAFIVEGELPKRRMVVDGGIVELLASGQQFVAIGEHTSGVRYEWSGGLPSDLPLLTLEQLNEAWDALDAIYATEASVEGRISRAKGAHIDLDDPVAEYLLDEGLVIGEASGKVFVICPWKDEHGDSESPTEACWHLAGTKGFEQGHYRCLHAHCLDRKDWEFKRAIGYDTSDFDVIPEPLPVAFKPGEKLRPQHVRLPDPGFVRNKQGQIEAVINNLVKAVERPHMCGAALGWDTFKDELCKAVEPGQWQPFRDVDYWEMRIRLENGGNGFAPLSMEAIKGCVLTIAARNEFDSARVWLDGLIWDGVPRVERFMANYFATADTEYAEAVSSYVWTALAGRVLSPGTKADMVPVLVGAQGCGKSTGVAAMAPDPMYFREISFHEDDDDKARKMRGCLVAELAELQGINSREAEGIKAFITRTHENWVPKYKEFATIFARRCLLMGTTNQEEFLADGTGNRRWLPIKSGNVDVGAIRRDCRQLWAEGAVRFLAGGVAYDAAERLGQLEHTNYMITDPWEPVIATWLDTDVDVARGRPRDWLDLTNDAVLRGCLDFDAQKITRRDRDRVRDVMSALNFTCKETRVDGKRGRFWRPASE